MLQKSGTTKQNSICESQSRLMVDNATQRLLDLTSLETRLDDDVEEILSIVKERAPKLLDGLARSTEKKIAQNLLIKYYERDEKVFLQNDIPDAHYTVIRGAVSIYALNSSTISKESMSHPHRKQYGKFLLQLPPGESFGELSFNADYKHSRRNAGVVSDGNHGQSRISDSVSNHEIESSDVAVLLLIPEKTYMTCMFARHASRNQTKDKIAFLKSSFLFNQWSMDQLVLMAYSMKKVPYEKGSRIVREGDRVDQIWIIRKGKMMISVAGKDTTHPLRSFTSKDQKKYGTIEIAELSSSDIFGLIEVVSGIKKMKRSATAVTPIEAFIISTTKFSSFLQCEPKTAALLEKVVQKRIEWEELRKDFANKFPTMPWTIPREALIMSKYSISRESVMSDQELKLRKEKSLVLCRYIRDARSSFRASMRKYASNNLKESATLLKKSAETSQKAIELTTEINDQERRKQLDDLLASILVQEKKILVH